MHPSGETGKPGRPEAPVCSGFPASSKLVGLDGLPTYLGVAAPLLLASAGAAIAPLLLLLVSAGAIAGAAGGAGAAAGVALSELLQAVSMTAAAARALRASFVFIDDPQMVRKEPESVV